jgi:hypothetical protein
MEAPDSQHREIDGGHEAFWPSACTPGGDENQADERDLK